MFRKTSLTSRINIIPYFHFNKIRFKFLTFLSNGCLVRAGTRTKRQTSSLILFHVARQLCHPHHIVSFLDDSKENKFKINGKSFSVKANSVRLSAPVGRKASLSRAVFACEPGKTSGT